MFRVKGKVDIPGRESLVDTHIGLVVFSST